MVQDDMMGATGTIGEGQIFVDNTTVSVTMMNFFGSALRTMCRKLRTTTGPMLIKDNVLIIGVPPMDSALQGLAAPDPGVQVALTYSGYFNGVSYNSNFVLPIDCLMVDVVSERVNGSNDAFRRLGQPSQGLPSGYQNVYNRIWEWRQDGVWLPGSIETMDLKLRYQQQLPALWTSAVNVADTYIPINDCVDTLAGFMIQLIAVRQGAAMLPATLQWAADQVNDFTNEQIKRDQGMPYQVVSFGGGNDQGGNLGTL
jgi:hypothetical protein